MGGARSTHYYSSLLPTWILRYFCAIFVGLLLFTIFFEHVLEKHVIISFTLTPRVFFVLTNIPFLRSHRSLSLSRSLARSVGSRTT